ncbi:MAG TPA: radical SAM protein [bacterium]|nr:radical SAM protein [bacterium]
MIDLDTLLRLLGMRLGDRALIGPQVVQIDLTDACTNNCLGCWARSPFLRDDDFYDTLKKGALDLPFVKQLLPVLREQRVREIFLGGGGDPLCHPQVFEVIRLAKEHGLQVTLNTNFTQADTDVVDGLIAAGLDLLVVSLWAGTSRTYAKLHPNKTEGTFRHLTEMLRYVADRKKRAGGAPRVKLYDVICKLNLDEIPQMIEHGRAVEAEEVELAAFDPIPRRTHIFTLNEREIEKALAYVAAIDRERPPFVHTELFTRRLQNIDATKGVFDNGIVASIPCAAGWFYSRVTTVGEVHACLKAHRIPVGEIPTYDFRAIWYGHGLQQFRAHTVKLHYDDPYLRMIGHDIDFALPGCFRICDNIGHNQHVMRLAGGLTDEEQATLAAMEQVARAGGDLQAIEDAYRQRLSGAAAAVPAFSPPAATATSSALVLHGDNEYVHELVDETPWAQVEAQLAQAGLERQIVVPVGLHNVARLDLVFALIKKHTGRALDPHDAALAPRPLADIHRRWPAQLERLRALAGQHRVILDLSDRDWQDALWKIAGAYRPEREAELLRALGALTGRAFIGPRTFHLDVTNACEADCVYCWFHSPLAQARTDAHRLTDADRDATMPWEMFRQLADDLAALEAKEDVVLSGKGDPLAHPRIAEMIRELKRRDLGVTLFTGGRRLDETIARACVEARLDLLYVSLSAASAATFARLRTAPDAAAFEEIVANVKRLLALRNAAGADQPRVVLVDVLTNRNDAEVVAFAELAAELGVDHLRYQLAAIEPYNRELALGAERLAALQPALAEAKTVAERAGVAVVTNIDFQVGGHGEGGDWTGERYRELGCLAGFVFGRAWADGTLSFCCAPRPIGNLNEQSFAAWWRDERYDRARLAARRLGAHADYSFADGTPLWTDVCRRCPNYEGIERLRTVIEEAELLTLLPPSRQE